MRWKIWDRLSSSWGKFWLPVLTYFRRAPQTEKYAITVLKPFEAYRIVALSGTRGVAPRLVEDRIYKTPDDAYHALFMRRVQDLMET